MKLLQVVEKVFITKETSKKLFRSPILVIWLVTVGVSVAVLFGGVLFKNAPFIHVSELNVQKEKKYKHYIYTINPKIHINHASREQLETLSGIGPKLAQRIITAREVEIFTSIDDLKRVKGIGNGKLAKIRVLITV